MGSIFEHSNGSAADVDHLTVQDEDTYLLFDGQSPGDYGDVGTRCRLDRDAVLRLHQALGEWLYPVHTPEQPNRSLIEQMIERAVRDQIAAVLPLHLSPTATVPVAEGLKLCQVPGCGWSTDRVHLEHDADPEPANVGHPGEPEPEHTKPRLMAELPRRVPRATTHCDACEHPWGDHTEGVCWGGAADFGFGCACTEKRLSAPLIGCTCTHPGPVAWEHGRLGCTYRASDPGAVYTCNCRWTGAS